VRWTVADEGRVGSGSQLGQNPPPALAARSCGRGYGDRHTERRKITMFTRMMTCTLKLDKKEEFLQAARQLPSAYKNQTGFVDLLTFISDDRPDHAIVLAVWNTKSDSQEFYKNRAPLLDLKPFLEEEQIEHYYLETSNVFKIAGDKAA
jgi:quinol monooxygenase YgiN